MLHGKVALWDVGPAPLECGRRRPCSTCGERVHEFPGMRARPPQDFGEAHGKLAEEEEAAGGGGVMAGGGAGHVRWRWVGRPVGEEWWIFFRYLGFLIFLTCGAHVHLNKWSPFVPPQQVGPAVNFANSFSIYNLCDL
jgi:hypothetical protein